MEKNSYQYFRDYICMLLNNQPQPLIPGKINEVIEKQKVALELLGLDHMNTILGTEMLEKLSDVEWLAIEKELEMHFDVQHDRGALVSGDEQKKRDNTWWTTKEKQQNELYYWKRYKDYVSNSLPYEVLKTVDDDTDVVMNNLANPTDQEFSRYGMVVGHVQSGKTANYSALVAKAADAGYKFIVVVAGGMNNLRNQTQQRINESFVGLHEGKRVGVGSLGGYKKEKRPISLTNPLQDFNKQEAESNINGLSFDVITTPIVLVIKKNTNTLKNVIDWLETHYEQGVSEHAMLLIDDESDYASINTKEENNPTIINERLRKLLSLFKKSAYVAYTATPYANIFIDHNVNSEDHGKDLFPEDFIYALEAPTNYFGAYKIFLNSEKKYLVEVNDYMDVLDPKHKKDQPIEELPESLEDAIRLFICNIAIRHLRKQENKHNSMLIHVTRFTQVHKNISIKVSEYFDLIKKSLNAHGYMDNPENRSSIISDIKETFFKHHKHMENKPLWNVLIKKISDIIESVVVREVHTETKIKLEYRDDVPTNAIVIGGSSLARGYTLEGLSVSYFLRTTVFYDTLMQMGRWFGYRVGYEDLCRIYMTNDMFNKFKTIIEATIDLVNSLQEMSRRGMTPKDFGLAVKQHPDSGLQVTARNKLKNTKELYFEMKLDGHLKETSWLPKSPEIQEHNLNVIRDLITALGDSHKKPGKSHVWESIRRETIEQFLEEFQTYTYSSDEFGIKTRMPLKFVKEYVKKIGTDWDIALYSGTAEKSFTNGEVIVKGQKRLIEERADFYEVLNRQVSSGNAEEITLTKEQKDELDNLSTQKKADKSFVFSRRKKTREFLQRPLLMLHILQGFKFTKNEETGENEVDKNDSGAELAAFGISFPGGIESGNRNIRLKVNSVYIEKELSGDEDSDD